mgnify:FL=1
MPIFDTDYDMKEYQKQVTRELKLFKNSEMGKCLFNFQKNIEKYPSLVRFFRLNTMTSYSFEGNHAHSCLLGQLITKAFDIKWEFYLSKFEYKNPNYDKLDNKIIDTLNNLTDDDYKALEDYIKTRNPFVDDYYDIYKDFEKFFRIILFYGKEQ